MKRLEAKQLYQDLQSNDCPYYILDVREQHERDQNAIQPSEHIPLDQLQEQSLDIPKDQPVVVYCHAGKRSAVACEYLLDWGWQDVYNLSDGILGWMRQMQHNN